jgi:hypothetical protein
VLHNQLAERQARGNYGQSLEQPIFGRNLEYQFFPLRPEPRPP